MFKTGKVHMENKKTCFIHKCCLLPRKTDIQNTHIREFTCIIYVKGNKIPIQTWLSDTQVTVRAHALWTYF